MFLNLHNKEQHNKDVMNINVQDQQVIKKMNMNNYDFYLMFNQII